MLQKSDAALGTGVGELSEEYNKVRVQNKKNRGVGLGEEGDTVHVPTKGVDLNQFRCNVNSSTS
jgi:hypothetical protein